ncbi:hypothetical protein GF326_13390 [Candidatus Bathyarchaeota archaeon]|nr:hypothetical protein [Candidatus Bathyarchaeota archaeon]
MIAEALCGRKMMVTKPPESIEEICQKCDKDKCMTHILYLYSATHQNNK